MNSTVLVSIGVSYILPQIIDVAVNMPPHVQVNSTCNA